MGHPSTRPKVVEYLSKHVGEHVFRGDIAKATKLTEDQVLSAINNIRMAHNNGELDFPIEIVQRGQIWCYRPDEEAEAKEASNMFEFVGNTQDGDLIVRNEEGTLFKAYKL